MRALMFAALVGCTATVRPTTTSSAVAAPPIVRDYPALQFAPPDPAYLVAAPTVRAAQAALSELRPLLAGWSGQPGDDAERVLFAIAVVDLASSHIATDLGVDLDGSIALFSDRFAPTLVVHLAAPDVTRAFFDRYAGLATTAQVDGVALHTARGLRFSASWVIDRDWLWLHVDGPDAATGWFVRHPSAARWGDRLARAQQLVHVATPLLGFWNPHDHLASAAARVGDAAECAKRLLAVDRVGFAASVDPHHVEAKVAFGLGASASRVASAILPPPPGFAALAQNAPVAAQWNVDLAAAEAALAPCLRAADIDLDTKGVRALRAVLATFDASHPTDAHAAISADLATPQLANQLIDHIPHVAIARDRTFGPYHGTHVSIPFVASVDYVLDHGVALAALGDGVLDQLVTGAPAAAPPLAEIDVRPSALDDAAWRWLFEKLFDDDGGRVAAALLQWHDAHIALSLDRDSLVLDVSGNRR